MEIQTEWVVPTEWRGFGYPGELTVRWEEGRVQYEAAGVVTEDGPELRRVVITGEDLHGVHLRSRIVAVWRQALAAAAIEARKEGGGFAAHEGVKRRVPVRRGRPRNPQAAVNRLHEIERGDSAKEVAERLGVSEGYARRLIAMTADSTDALPA